jgi:hypothetical protein
MEEVVSVYVNGEEIVVPSGRVTGLGMPQPRSLRLTGRELRQLLKLEKHELPYQITEEGHRLIRDEDVVEVKDGDVYGTMTRVTAASRNIRRIETEIELLCKVFGEEAVTWSPDYSWVMVQGVKLPPKYNKRATNVLILIPENYGYGEPLQDLFVDPDLKIIVNGKPEDIPHYFPKRGSGLAKRFQKQYGKNWRYLCLKQEQWDPKRDHLLGYLNQLYTFLSDPFGWPYQA